MSEVKQAIYPALAKATIGTPGAAIITSEADYLDRKRVCLPWLDNEDYCFQLTQLLGVVAQEGASAISDCLMTAARITPSDDESWHREWKKTAEITRERGDLAFASGNIATAQGNWLRASNYFRAAELFLRFGDVRRRPVLEQMRASSGRYLEHTRPPGEIVKITNFDGGVIEGYFLRALGVASPMPVVLCVGGPEHLKDEHLYKMRRHAHDRGLSLLLVDLLEPGTFEQKKMSGRHDTATSIGSCVDYLVSRGDVDEQRIAIYGDGLGASIATQAAAQDLRFSAAVCDGGMLDSLQWAFSFQQLVGADDCESVKRNIENLKLHSIAKRIHCPILITIGECEGLDATYAAELCNRAKAAGSNINLKIFSHLETAAFNPQSPNPTIVCEFVFDWIADRPKNSIRIKK
jgi:dienelactone hydrolase